MSDIYIPYDSCILRTPLFPISDIEKSENIESVIANNIFSEAIYLSSSSLYEKVYKRCDAITERVQNSLLRYYSRACTRATPYGLFAGCDILTVDMTQGVSSVILSDISDYETYTRIDMNILCELARFLEKDEIVQKKLTYHINSTLYSNGLGYNYIEYSLDSYKRKYTLSLVSKSYYLDKIIELLMDKQSLSYNDLIKYLIKMKVDKDVAESFVADLIKEGILVSCLEPSVVGKDYIYQLIDNLKLLDISAHPFLELEEGLREIDMIPLGQRIVNYDALVNKFIKNNDSSIYHVDTKNTIASGVIGKDIIEVVLECADFLLDIEQEKKSPINLFINKFYERFEEEEVPLSIALDPQVGIEYGVWHNTNGDINPLINDIPLPENRTYTQSTINFFQQILMDKYDQALINNENTIDLKGCLGNKLQLEKDKINFFYTIFSVVNSSPIQIHMRSIVDSSYVKLASRFQYLSPKIKELIDSISNYEETKLSKNCIYAEILHLPEDRIGNIQMHPINRAYAIPYLSNAPTCENLKIIPISDILISTPNGKRVRLWSKKYKKEICPILSTAHNYSYGLPLYAFLCELDSYNKQAYNFHWGEWSNGKKYLPRVCYGKNIILCPAQWRLKHDDCLKIIDCLSCDDECISSIYDTYGLPTTFFIVEGDNKLFVDLKVSNLKKMFCHYIKSKNNILLEECLYDFHEKGFVTKDNDVFANEILIGFYRK